MADVRSDDRGAVLLTGLFMACFLIGSLWFIVGIGDALVYRDRMQEATDHGAFSAAALNAKGMNFVSLCNLVLLAAVAIHIILGILHDIALALCIVSLGLTCGFWQGVRQYYTNYFNVLKPAARAIHNATKVSSYGFPVMGLAEGLNIGRSYAGGKNTRPNVIALSPSLLRGASFTSTPGASRKEGLTLQAEPMSLVCRRIGSMAIDALFKKALGVSGRGFAGKVLSLAKTIVGRVIEARYCNDMGSRERIAENLRVSDFIKEGEDYLGKKVSDATGGIIHAGTLGGGMGGTGGTGGTSGTGGSKRSGESSGVDPGFNSFWGEDGPMVVIGPASNGNTWFQSYSINLNPQLTDGSESFVGLGVGPKQSRGRYDVKVKPKGGFYLAQAEYYFDCAEKWRNDGCNFEGNSTFALKWRSRLRRFSLPSFSQLLSTVGGQFATQIPQYDQFKRLQGQFDMAGDLFGQNGILGMKDLNAFMGQASRRAENALLDAATDALRDKAKSAGQSIDVPFH